MSMLEQVVRLDMKPQKNPPHVDCTQYDSGSDGWLIRAYLFNNGSKFVIPSGYTAKIEGTTKENTGFTFAASSVDNANGVVTFTLNDDATAVKGSAWCKIVFEKGSSRIATSGFWLDNDRAGVEAETILHSPGFQEQINQGVAEYFDNDPPFFTLPEGGEAGQALLSDGADGAFWGEAGIPEAVKTALLACFENVAWEGTDGQSYYDALHAALYAETPVPPSDNWTWQYSPTQGKLSDMSYITMSNVGEYTEEVVNGLLHINVPAPSNASSNVKFSLTQATNTHSKMRARVRFNALTFSQAGSNFRLQLSNGTSGAQVFERKTAANSSNYKLGYYIGSVYSEPLALELNRWYELEVELNNGLQTVKVDDFAIIENESPSTNYASANAIFAQAAQNGGTPCDVDIEWIKYRSYD